MPGKVTDHLANERTFLAWVRTALGLIGLGFVLGRMGLFLRQIAASADTKAIRTGHEFIVVGVVFLVFGTLFGAWSGWNYERNRRAIDRETFVAAKWSIYLLAVVVVVGSLAIVALSVWRMTAGG